MIEKGLHLLKGSIYETFPLVVKELNSTEWVQFAQLIEDLRNELVSEGDPSKDSYSIEDLDYIFDSVRIPNKVLLQVAEFINARFRTVDSAETIKKKIASATANNRLHATTGQIKDLIEEITGFTPSIRVRTEFGTGWDETETISPDIDPIRVLDFLGGIMWDETDVLDSTFPKFYWEVLPSGLLIDLKNDGNFTTEQLNEVYALVAELKNAELAADVGYVSSITGQDVILKTIYSTTIADPAFDGYSQTTWPNNPDPGE